MAKLQHCLSHPLIPLRYVDRRVNLDLDNLAEHPQVRQGGRQGAFTGQFHRAGVWYRNEKQQHFKPSVQEVIINSHKKFLYSTLF